MGNYSPEYYAEDAVFPTVGQVLASVTYGIDGNNLTGTYVVVSANDVRSGVTFGPASASTGTLLVSGISFDATYRGTAV